MGRVDDGLYRHAGGAMLRAAALPPDQIPATWPRLNDVDSCCSWLQTIWRIPAVAQAIRHASAPFAAQVEAILNQEITERRQIRRTTLSTTRYLLRMAGRPTPFGLFAGVAPVRVSGDVHATWEGQHRALVRPDTLWLDGAIERLEASREVLPHLDVVVSDLVVDRGDRVEMPRGSGRVTMRNTAVVRWIRKEAAAPINVSVLGYRIAGAFPGAQFSAIAGTLRTLVAQGVLITNLRAPMTEPDPLGHLIEILEGAASTVDEVSAAVEELRVVQRTIGAHNTVITSPGGRGRGRERLRRKATEQMRRVSTAGRVTLASDLHLACDVTVPSELAAEMAAAVAALVRLTRQPRPDAAWNDWCREFWDRYGTGAIVPVTEALHPDSGVGWPPGYPASVLPDPKDAEVSHRDQALLRLAWEAVADVSGEIVLTDDIIDDITAEQPIDTRWIPSHVELGARVRATTLEALRAGDYTFTVHPAWAFGTLTSRFGPAVASSGLDATFASTPPAVAGALSVQLSFPPLFPHAENVARGPTWLPHVLSLGEHRPDGDSGVLRLDDIGIVAVDDGLHLISISRRQVIEPQVFHALALKKQAPPLARFLATLTRGFHARYTEFAWGPPASDLPYLPRVRYGRAVLAPATWNLDASEHAAMVAENGTWNKSLSRWRAHRMCPDLVELHDEHRTLRLDLSVGTHRQILREHLAKHGHARLTETPSAAEMGWIAGHVHEVVMPFARTTPPAPNLVSGSLPLVTNASSAQRPAAPQTSWLYAQVFTHPERLDDIIRTHLPRLMDSAGSNRAYWFARYRSVRETEHLRLRIRVTGPEDYAAIAGVVGSWGQELCESGAASRIALATYHPEVGRYGHGAAMRAAEAVFAADSHAVALAFSLLSPKTIHPMALAAIGMVELTHGFHADSDQATDWLLQRLAGKAGPSNDREVAAQVSRWVTLGVLPGGSPFPAALGAAWERRRVALGQYRLSLPGDADADRILSALLHMHHNRARFIDREDEAACLRLARKAALAARACTAGEVR